jgi:TRAP-type C4-dicarboxylate transport system substrate-binding protein
MKEAGAVINEVGDRSKFQAAGKPVWDKYGVQQQQLIQRIQDVK